MQQPTFFENEIVQPKNLSFLNDSTAKNIKDVVVAIGGGVSGKVSGLTLSGVSGNNHFVVSPGYGYMGDGERVQIYSTGINVSIAFTGTESIYLNFTSAVWNPDPTINPLGSSFVVTNVDPTDDSLVAVENYNIAIITTSSGVNYIPLGTVTADSSMNYLTSSASGSRDFTIGGIIDINTSTINGVNIAAGTLDSNSFVSELHYGISLSTGVNIGLTASGNNNIGSANHPLSNVYSLTGNFHQLNGFSPILIDTMKQISGTSLEGTGNNFVQIDTNNKGTRFGKGITLNTNSISTVGVDADINMSTDALRRVNINSIANVNDLFVKNNLTVTGIANFAATNIASITGNLSIVGSLSFGATSQLYNNAVTNPAFSLTPSGDAGVGLAPQLWSIVTANSIYAYGPVPLAAPNQTLTAPAGFLALANNLNVTGNYTIEMNININGPSSYTVQQNELFYKQHGTNSNFNGQLFVTAASGLRFDSFNSPLASPTGMIHDKQWYNVAYAWDGAQRHIYIDGVPVGNDSIDGAWHAGVVATLFGAAQPNQALINGLINNIRVSNIARTSFPSGSAHALPDFNTLAYWGLNNNLLDSTPNNFTLISNNGSVPTPFTDTRLGQVFSGTINIAANDILPVGTKNSLYGDPHTNTWLLCSGNNIDSTGVFMWSATNLKANTNYNFSYYAKGITGTNNIGIINYAWGTSPSGTYVQNPTTIATPITSSEWTRYTTNVLTPISGSGFNFALAIRDTLSTGTINPIFGITAVQATEGSAIVPYQPQLQKPRIAYYHETFGAITLPANVTTVLESTTAFVNAGLVRVNSELSLAIVTSLCSSYFWLEIDGIIKRAGVFAGQVPSFSSFSPSWEGYLATGYHTFRLLIQADTGNDVVVRPRDGLVLAGGVVFNCPTTLLVTEL